MSTITRTAQRLGIDPRALIGLAVLVIGTLVWALAFTNEIASLFNGQTKTVRADFASIEDIVPNDPVRVDGVQVGTVGGSSTDPGGRGATLTLNLDSDAPAIYRNASAQIVWRTALGANDAIRLDPGTRSAGLLGDATIPQSQDTNQVELDQITQAAFHGGAQSGLRTMLQQLAPALDLNHATLNDDFDTLARIAPQATVGIGAVRGELKDTDLRNLIRDAGQAAQALSVGTDAASTRAFVQSAATTLTAISANQADLRSSISGLAGTEQDVIDVYPKIHDTLTRVNELIPRLLPSAPRVGPTLAVLQPAVSHLDTLLHDATPLLGHLRPAVHSLANTASAGIPVIDQLNPSLTQLQNKVLPGLDERYPENGGRAVYQIMGGTVVALATLSHFFDGQGGMANLTVAGNAFNQTSQSILPCDTDFAGKDLLVCETISQALATYTDLGTGFLQHLRRSAPPSLGSWIDRQIGANSGFAKQAGKLSSAFPALGKWLLGADHGGVKLR